MVGRFFFVVMLRRLVRASKRSFPCWAFVFHFEQRAPRSAVCTPPQIGGLGVAAPPARQWQRSARRAQLRGCFRPATADLRGTVRARRHEAGNEELLLIASLMVPQHRAGLRGMFRARVLRWQCDRVGYGLWRRDRGSAYMISLALLRSLCCCALQSPLLTFNQP
jgi:hypothetical protein